MTDPVDGVSNTEPGNWAPRQLVYAADVLRALPGTSSEAAAFAAEQASAYVLGYCTRGISYDRAPVVPRRVALALALRIDSNPTGIRTVGTEGQSLGYGPTGLTYLESVLLSRWRRRSA